MSTAPHRLPTRATAPAGARLGCHRHFTVVVPFIRSSYALRSVRFAAGREADADADFCLPRAYSADAGIRSEDLPHVA